MKILKIRPHHFNLLLLIWYPTERWGGNPLDWLGEDYGPKYVKFLSKLSTNIRNGNNLLIEPTSSMDAFCDYCRKVSTKYKPSCENPDNNYRNSMRLFFDMDLEYDTPYPAKEIVKKMDEWVEKNPDLPIQE